MLFEGHDVQERLGGMGAGSIAGIDEVQSRVSHLRQWGQGAVFRMPNHHHVRRHGLQGAKRVHQGFALFHRTVRRRGVDHAQAKPQRRGWSDALRASVQEAEADLDAVLARMKLPISKIEGFAVGQVVALAGTTVGSVRLIGPGDEEVATARLGQVAGKRAVRIEVPRVEMEEAPPHAAPAAPQPQPALPEALNVAGETNA